MLGDGAIKKFAARRAYCSNGRSSRLTRVVRPAGAMSARQTQDSVAKDGSPILGLPRSPKGVWRRGRLDLTGGDLFWHDGNVHWRCRAVSDGNSPARSPSCRDCAFLPVVRYRCLCRDRCRLSVTRPDSGGDRRPGGVLFRLNSFASVKTKAPARE
jgi:hypothetical protein